MSEARAPWLGEVVRIGGLMRCCTDTLGRRLMEDDMEPKDGEVVRCMHAPDDEYHVMVRRHGGWEWSKPVEVLR